MSDKAYGWKDKDGKYRVSKMPPGLKYRPSNVYETMQEALTEAGKRGVAIEWERGTE